MARQEASLHLALILATVLWSGTSSQSSDCTTVIISMSPCLNYITGNSTSPAAACCTQLRTVVRSRPECLCQVLNGGGSSLGLTINQTQALALPRLCNVQTPPTSQCNAASPTGSPGSTTANSPNTNSGDGSNTVPPHDGDSTSDANYNKLGASMQFSIVFIASYVVSTSTVT